MYLNHQNVSVKISPLTCKGSEGSVTQPILVLGTRYFKGSIICIPINNAPKHASFLLSKTKLSADARGK